MLQINPNCGNERARAKNKQFIRILLADTPLKRVRNTESMAELGEILQPFDALNCPADVRTALGSGLLEVDNRAAPVYVSIRAI